MYEPGVPLSNIDNNIYSDKTALNLPLKNMKNRIPQPEIFQYLFTPKTEDYKIDDVIEIKYSDMNSLGNRFIARNSLNNKYYIFENMDEFEIYFGELQGDFKCFHEVILNRNPQKIKFDIDAEEFYVNKYFDDAVKCDPEFEEKHSYALSNLSSSDKMKIILSEIDTAISQSFYALYQKEITSEDIITTESTGKIDSGETKFSFHKFIKGFCVESSGEVLYYVSEFFRKFLRPDFHDLVDFEVYKTTQNFRIVHNHKERSNRTKLPIGFKEGDPLEIKKYLIQHVEDCEKLPNKRINSTAAKITGQGFGDISSSQNLHPNDVNKAIEIAIKYGLSIAPEVATGENIQDRENAAFSIHKVTGSLITFKRLRPSECEICKSRHDADNTLMLSVVTSSFGNDTVRDNDADDISPQNSSTAITSYISRIYMLCRHKKKAKIFIGSFEPELSEEVMLSIGVTADPIESKRKLQERILEEIINTHTDSAEISGNNLPSDQLKFSSMSNNCKNIYSEKSLRDFEYVDTLCVRAGMKMGKTKKLTQYVDKYFSDSDYYTNNIILISFRQTFSKEIQNKFPGFKLYSEVTGDIDEARLIIQVESLHRISISPSSAKPDLLILDECESIFDQFDSGLHKKFSESWAVFRWLLANSKHMVCMDAGLSNRTYEILNRMRMGEFAKERSAASGERAIMYYHFNTYKNAINDKYFITVDKNEWYLDLYNSIANGERVAVPMSSLAEARVLKENIEKKFPKLRVGFYSSKTPMSEKKLHFSNVDEYWSCYDVLIYTPTVSAGISFEREHFHKIYAYFTDQSCHAEVCHQMIGRIRNVITGIHVVYIDSMRRNFPANVPSVKSALYDSRSNLFKSIGDSPLQFDYQANGKIKFYENDYFHMWLENTVVKNASKNNFMKRFIQIISIMGPEIKRLHVNANVADIVGIELENKAMKTTIKESEIKKISDSPELSYPEIVAIQNKLMERGDETDRAQEDVTEDEFFGYEKFRLRRDYQWGGPIDNKFVSEYNNQRSKRIFKNLIRIHCKDNIYDSLKQIQEEERTNYEIAIDGEDKHQYGDIKRRYVFNDHWLAIEFLRICGISSLRDTSWKSQSDLKSAFRTHEKKMYSELIKAHSAYGIKRPSTYTFTYSDTKSAQNYVDGILEFVNKVLLLMYGVKISSSQSEPDMYNLKPNKMFDLVTKIDENSEIVPGSRYPFKKPCINAKWRPINHDSGEYDLNNIKYTHIEPDDIEDVPDHIKLKLGVC